LLARQVLLIFLLWETQLQQAGKMCNGVMCRQLAEEDFLLALIIGSSIRAFGISHVIRHCLRLPDK
jgi:hypothetical protein